MQLHRRVDSYMIGAEIIMYIADGLESRILIANIFLKMNFLWLGLLIDTGTTCGCLFIYKDIYASMHHIDLFL